MALGHDPQRQSPESGTAQVQPFSAGDTVNPVELIAAPAEQPVREYPDGHEAVQFPHAPTNSHDATAVLYRDSIETVCLASRGPPVS